MIKNPAKAVTYAIYYTSIMQ